MRKRVHAQQVPEVIDKTLPDDIQSRKMLKVPKNTATQQEEFKITKDDAVTLYRGVSELYKSQDNHSISIGREQELKQITEFVQTNITSDQSGLLYVCGHPGTGKTSLLNQILAQYEDRYIVIKLNANSYSEFPVLMKAILARMQDLLLQNSSAQKKKKESPVAIVKPEKTIEAQTQWLVSSLIQMKADHLVLVIDEVDAFAHIPSQQVAFTSFLKQILSPDLVVTRKTKDKIVVCGVTIIGIANSIELFKGEYTASTASMSSKLICKNEEKIIFSPYSRSQVSQILKNICDSYIDSRYPVDHRKLLKDSLLTQRAIDLIAMKVNKLSGDLRQAFDILRATIQKKLCQLENSDCDNLSITYEDTNRTINEIYQSKTVGIIRKVPRSHIILLIVLEETLRKTDRRTIEQGALLELYNRRASELMIERIRVNDLVDMVETLVNFSILTRDKKKKTVVGLQVELNELTEALEMTQDAQERKELDQS